MKFAKNVLLLLIPALVPATGLMAMAVVAGAFSENIILTLLFTIGAGLINVVPFGLLFALHFRRVRDKTGPRNYSFYTAYILATLVMLVVVPLALREVSLGRPGSQFSALALIFLPRLTVPTMLISYIIGWVVERVIRRRSSVYAAQDMPLHKALRVHFSKYKVVYIVLFVLAAMLLGHSLLLSIIPLPNIHLAAELGSIRQVRRFIEKGVDINAVNEDGETPLHMAVFNRNKDVFEFLIANGAEVNAKSNDGDTILHDVAWAGETEMVSILIKHGADVNARDNSGDTPLHEAVRKGRTAAVKQLIMNGADVTVADRRGRTALGIARKEHFKSIELLLLENGAKE